MLGRAQPPLPAASNQGPATMPPSYTSSAFGMPQMPRLVATRHGSTPTMGNSLVPRRCSFLAGNSTLQSSHDNLLFANQSESPWSTTTGLDFNRSAGHCITLHDEAEADGAASKSIFEGIDQVAVAAATNHDDDMERTSPNPLPLCPLPVQAQQADHSCVSSWQSHSRVGISST